jgi:hypothetical protein
MQPDNPTGELDARYDPQSVPAEQDAPAAVSEAINVVCDELFSSHTLGAAADAQY